MPQKLIDILTSNLELDQKRVYRVDDRSISDA